MGKTIEDRLDDLIDAHFDVIDGREKDLGKSINARYAIIDICDAAIKAMKAIVSVDLDTKHGAHYCHGCHSDLPNHSERHKPATCRIAALQDVIAQMEGN